MSTIHRGDSERRDFIRMGVECPMTIREPETGEMHEGMCKNLSGKGILFAASRAYAVGARLEVRVTPGTTLTEPLDLEIEVVRCNTLPDGGYEVAGEKLK